MLENLRQLNLRLMDWHAQLAPGPPRTLQRGEAVRQVLIRHHARADFCLADLPRELRLKECQSQFTLQISR